MKQHDRVIGPGGADLVHVEPDGLNAAKGNMRVTTADSAIMQPVEIQGHLSQTIQTHTAVSVPLSGTNQGPASWIDTNGYFSIGTMVRSDASHSLTLKLVWSNDGVNIHNTQSLVTGTGSDASGHTETRARYVKVQIENGDAAAAHVMSAWAYLKA